MNYQELVSLVNGDNPQAATYQDIVSGIQSQYRPQTRFAPTTSLLDMIGNQLPEQPRIAYGSLLQAQPRTLPPSINLGATSIKNPDAAASLDSGVINLGTETANTGLGGGRDLSGTLVYNNDFTNTGTTGITTDTTNRGLFGTNVTGTDVANVAGTIAPIAALAGDSDLVKTAIALNLIGSAADIRTEQDVINLGSRIAMLAAGPAGNVLAAGLGLATDNTPMTVNALLGLTNPTLSLINSISGNITGYTLGDIVNGLLNAPEGSVSEYGLLGAANLAGTADASRRRAGIAYDTMDANTLRVLAELGDQEAIATINSMSGGTSTYNPISDLGTARGNSYFNLFTPVGGSGGGGGNPNLNYWNRAILAE
jgi:hypothetical protein